MNNILPTDIVLCTMQKGEYLYLDEWLQYNIEVLKFDKIFLYNDDENQNLILDLPYVKKLLEENKLIIEKQHHTVGKIMKSYQDFYNNNVFRWAAFFDIDEFLDLKTYKDIHEYIDYVETKYMNNVNIIFFPWKNFGDNDNIKYENLPVRKRFKTPCNIKFQKCKNSYIYGVKDYIEKKFIVKYGIGKIEINNPHFIEVKYGKPLVGLNSNETMANVYLPLMPFYDDIYPVLNHYRTKSCEEFINKISKGKPDFDSNKDFWPIDMFFEYNEYSIEKENYMKTLLNERKK